MKRIKNSKGKTILVGAKKVRCRTCKRSGTTNAALVPKGATWIDACGECKRG